MPTPRKNEKRKDFVSRAISVIMKEGVKDIKHATAKAYGMWRQYKKKQNK